MRNTNQKTALTYGCLVEEFMMMMMMMMMMMNYFEICCKYDTHHIFKLDKVKKTWRLMASRRFIPKLTRTTSTSFLMVLSPNLHYFSGYTCVSILRA
jgi:hypothetical protein